MDASEDDQRPAEVDFSADSVTLCSSANFFLGVPLSIDEREPNVGSFNPLESCFLRLVEPDDDCWSELEDPEPIVLCSSTNCFPIVA